MNERVDLSISQFLDAWNIFGRGCAGSRMGSTAGVHYVFTGLPIPFFNIAVPTLGPLSAPALEATARGAMQWAATFRGPGSSNPGGTPWLFVVTNDHLDAGVDAAAVLAPCGLMPLLPLTGMVATRIAPAASLPDGLQLELPEDDAGCGDAIDVNSAAYGMDLTACKGAYGRGSFWADHLLVLGRAAGAPATSAAVMLAGGHRYVALVATQPGQQKKGFAEAAMRYALSSAAEKFGERPSFLHATEVGRPIYARMGYEAVATHTCFIDATFMGGH